MRRGPEALVERTPPMVAPPWSGVARRGLKSIGSKASIWPFAAMSASMSASGVAAFAGSTSSSASYRGTPEESETSRGRAGCAGRPGARVGPLATAPMALAFASAHCTASSTSLASRGLSLSVIVSGRVSESRDIRERHLSAADVHAAELGAAVQRGKHLAGIEQALVVECAFQALLLVEVDLGEH